MSNCIMYHCMIMLHITAHCLLLRETVLTSVVVITAHDFLNCYEMRDDAITCSGRNPFGFCRQKHGDQGTQIAVDRNHEAWNENWQKMDYTPAKTKWYPGRPQFPSELHSSKYQRPSQDQTHVMLNWRKKCLAYEYPQLQQNHNDFSADKVICFHVSRTNYQNSCESRVHCNTFGWMFTKTFAVPVGLQKIKTATNKPTLINP